MSVFLIRGITFNNKCLYSVIFCLQPTSCIYNTSSQFNNHRVRIVYQVIVHNKCSRHPPAELMHSWIRLTMDCCTLVYE
jgi:hypothetical protein